MNKKTIEIYNKTMDTWYPKVGGETLIIPPRTRHTVSVKNSELRAIRENTGLSVRLTK